MDPESIRPLVADTDALLALGNSVLWEVVANNVAISTTQTCRTELINHKRQGDEQRQFNVSARRRRLSSSAKNVLNAIESSETAIQSHYLSQCRNGEHSIAKLINTNPAVVKGILMMDFGEDDDLELGGRELIKAHVKIDQHDIVFLSPAYPLVPLYEADLIAQKQFCQATETIIREEDWTSYSAVKRMWEGIPIDCGGYVPADYRHPTRL